MKREERVCAGASLVVTFTIGDFAAACPFDEGDLRIF